MEGGSESTPEELKKMKEALYPVIWQYLISKGGTRAGEEGVDEARVKDFLSEMQKTIAEEEEKRERRRKAHEEWRRRINEERRIDDAWHEIEGAFGLRKFCRICGSEMSDHREAGHRFVPKIQVDEDIVDHRKLKTVDYYLCVRSGDLQVRRVTRPDRELLEREYTVYEALHDMPFWLQAALIATGKLREFLGTVQGSTDSEKGTKIKKIMDSLPEPPMDEERGNGGEIGEILEEIGDLVDGIWDDSYALKELMTVIEMSFGEEEYCRICGRERRDHEGAEHGFEPKIWVDRDVVDERKLMSEEQHLCIHDNRLCVKRIMSCDMGGEHVYYEEDLPPWEYEFTRALFEKGRIMDFLELVRDRLKGERAAYRQAAKYVENLPKAGAGTLRRFR